MTLSRTTMRLINSLLTLSFLICVVCQPAIVSCSHVLKVTTSNCCCCDSTASAKEKQHNCCQQKRQEKSAGSCHCHHQLPPANVPQPNKTDSENLIVSYHTIAIVQETTQVQNSLQSLLVNLLCSQSVSLNLSLCVWLT